MSVHGADGGGAVVSGPVCWHCEGPHLTVDCDYGSRLTDQERLQRRYCGEWPAFLDGVQQKALDNLTQLSQELGGYDELPAPAPKRACVAILIRPTAEPGQFRWQVRAGTYHAVGHAGNAGVALRDAFDACKAVGL
jgi:hypothetical protein